MFALAIRKSFKSGYLFKIMKKGILILFIVLLLVVAAGASNNNENIVDSENDEDDENGLESINDKEIGEDIENISTDIRDSTDKAFRQEVEFPQTLGRAFEIVFRVKTEEITYQLFIIMIVVFVMLFLIFRNFLNSLLLIKGGLLLILSLIAILIVSFSGGVTKISLFIVNIGGFFEMLEGWSPFAILVSIIIAVFLVWGFNKLSRFLEKKYMSNISMVKGLKTATGIEAINMYSDKFRS